MGASILLDSPAIVADPFPVYERLRREAQGDDRRGGDAPIWD